ncbi:hypothetical protein EXIGLDRAFT_351054 [Exidia glandulosa HHB12029]|uniref:Uncharacterized protein n=1 Tax=Exidia glandulosa HHB12029 TaxID=1314781 RepID=A0A165CD64_EXIGL|nr:hypothetical protein EXIGLDRAFT_351054 [Exidia glandulosa HHB12029]
MHVQEHAPAHRVPDAMDSSPATNDCDPAESSAAHLPRVRLACSKPNLGVEKQRTAGFCGCSVGPLGVHKKPTEPRASLPITWRPISGRARCALSSQKGPSSQKRS